MSRGLIRCQKYVSDEFSFAFARRWQMLRPLLNLRRSEVSSAFIARGKALCRDDEDCVPKEIRRSFLIEQGD